MEELIYETNEKTTLEDFIRGLLLYGSDPEIKNWRYSYEEISHKYSCICGHYIQDNYFIKNINSGKILVVGSSCIKRFFPTKKCKNCDNLLKSLSKFDICSSCRKFVNEYKKRIKDIEKLIRELNSRISIIENMKLTRKKNNCKFIYDSEEEEISTCRRRIERSLNQMGVIENHLN